MSTALGEQSTRTHPILGVARRLPATGALVAAILVAGVTWGGLWSPFQDSALYEQVAYGLPAFEAGRWWTPVTGTFFVNMPWVYVFTIGGFVGMAYLEFRRGSVVALAYFGIGQLFAIFATALFLALARLLPWPWAVAEAAELDVGASGGTMACIAAAIGLLGSLWRVRGWLILLAFVLVALLFWGALADIEHAFAVGLILFVDRTLRVQNTTLREQRLIALVAILTLGAVQIITTITPTEGPFGPTAPVSGPWLDVAIDTVVILLVANGLRRGRRWAWVVSVVLASLNVATAGLLIALVSSIADPAYMQSALGDIDVTLATSVLWLAFLVYIVWTRRAFAARRRTPLGREAEPAADEVKAVIRSSGGGTLSWMATWDGMDYLRTATGIVPFRRHAGVAIVLGDPLGPEAGRADSVGEFIRAAERAGLIPCFFSAGSETKAAVPSHWRSLVVADDTIVDLPGLAFTGKRWNTVRTSMNRAGRESMSFRMSRLADETWGVRQQLRAISEMWVGDKGLPEMGFTLGTLTEAEDPEVRIALAVSDRGDVDGFLSWLPIYGEGGTARGWTLDLMRRREGGFGPVMEFLIGSSAAHFRDEGAAILSLSGAPLAHENPPDAGVIADLTAKLSEVLEPVYGFASLHRFKQKFNPRYESIYLLYRDEGDLTRISAALTKAFLPDATLRQFAGAGVGLVRRGHD